MLIKIDQKIKKITKQIFSIIPLKNNNLIPKNSTQNNVNQIITKILTKTNCLKKNFNQKFLF